MRRAARPKGRESADKEWRSRQHCPGAPHVHPDDAVSTASSPFGTITNGAAGQVLTASPSLSALSRPWGRAARASPQLLRRGVLRP